jgi:hypothetical protein
MSYIVIVPAGVLVPSTQAEFVAFIVPDDIERHLAQQRKGSRCHFIATARIVFPEGDIQHPMQAIFQSPSGGARLESNPRAHHRNGSGNSVCRPGFHSDARRCGWFLSPRYCESRANPVTAPAMTALTAMIRIPISLCWARPGRRGSDNAEKDFTIPSTMTFLLCFKKWKSIA